MPTSTKILADCLLCESTILATFIDVIFYNFYNKPQVRSFAVGKCDCVPGGHSLLLQQHQIFFAWLLYYMMSWSLSCLTIFHEVGNNYNSNGAK